MQTNQWRSNRGYRLSQIFFMGPTSVQTKGKQHTKLNKLDLMGSSRMCIYDERKSEESEFIILYLTCWTNDLYNHIWIPLDFSMRLGIFFFFKYHILAYQF